MKALILRGQIIQVCEQEFEVHPDYQWVDCPGECSTNWIYQDGVFLQPEPEVTIPDPNDIINKKIDAMWHFCDTGDRSVIDTVKQEL